MSHIILFHFISFAKTKHNKQTNKQKERWQGHRNSCGQLQRARIQIKRKKKKHLKITAIQESYSYTQQVIGRDKGRALLHFKQIDLNERGSSQS